MRRELVMQLRLIDVAMVMAMVTLLVLVLLVLG